MAAVRKTKYVSLDGGTDITTPVLEMKEGDFIYTFNMEPNKTKGISSARGYERIDGNHTNPSNVTLHIYAYDGLTGTTPVQGDTITESGDLYTVCGITSTHIYLVTTADPIAGAVSVFITGDGGFVTTAYRFIQRIPGSKFPPTLLSQTERDFYDFAVETQRSNIDAVPGTGPVVGVAQDPSSRNILAIRSNGVNDILYESIPGTGWTAVAGTSFTSSTSYRFADITQGGTSRRLYIVNGVDDPHYYDSVAPAVGTIDVTVTPSPPMLNQPSFVEVHDDRVVFAANNEVFLSGPETPVFTLNAFILSTNYIIVGLSKFIDDSLFVPTEESLYILQGSPDELAANFGSFKEHSRHTGAIENTVDAADYPYFINRYGISNLRDTDAAGEFKLSNISDKVLPIIRNNYDKDGIPVTYVGSFIDRAKNLYRAYRSDGVSYNLLKDEEREYPITFNDYKVGLQCIEEFKDSDDEFVIAGSGYDENFAGNYSGYVYRMESGHSLDGDTITHSIKTPYAHFSSPAIKKRVFKYTANISSPEMITVTYKADFNLGDSRYSDQQDITTISGLSRFNQSSFNAATWSSKYVDEIGGYINGSGQTISLSINVTTKNTEDFTLQGIIYHYKTRGMKR